MGDGNGLWGVGSPEDPASYQRATPVWHAEPTQRYGSVATPGQWVTQWVADVYPEEEFIPFSFVPTAPSTPTNSECDGISFCSFCDGELCSNCVDLLLVDHEYRAHIMRMYPCRTWGYYLAIWVDLHDDSSSLTAGRIMSVVKKYDLWAPPLVGVELNPGPLSDSDSDTKSVDLVNKTKRREERAIAKIIRGELNAYEARKTASHESSDKVAVERTHRFELPSFEVKEPFLVDGRFLPTFLLVLFWILLVPPFTPLGLLWFLWSRIFPDDKLFVKRYEACDENVLLYDGKQSDRRVVEHFSGDAQRNCHNSTYVIHTQRGSINVTVNVEVFHNVVNRYVSRESCDLLDMISYAGKLSLLATDMSQTAILVDTCKVARAYVLVLQEKLGTDF
jgi:hypothetical protein